MIPTRAARAITATAVLVSIAQVTTIAGTAAARETGGSVAEIKAADHLGFGRVVINTNGKANYQIEQNGDHVIVHVTGDVSLAGAPAAPRNIVTIRSDGATLDLVLAHGAQLHTSRVNGHIVLDALDVAVPAAKPPQAPPPQAATPQAATPQAATQAAPHPEPHLVPVLPPPTRASKAAAQPPVPTPPPAPPLPPAPGPAQDQAAPQALTPPPTLPRVLGPPSLTRPGTMADSPELGGRSVVSPPETPEPTTAERVPVVAQPLAIPPAVPLAAATPPTVPPGPAAGPPLQAPAAPTAPTEPLAPVSTATGLETVQPTPPGRDVLPEVEGPLLLRARRTRLPRDMDGTGFIVPFETTTAAAAFEQGDTTIIVFDERRPIDLGGLARDPLFSAASVRLLPNGTVFQVPHPASLSIILTQLPQGWRVAAVTTKPKLQPINATGVDKRLNLAADQPGDVVNLADPVTGATLLVGTQHRPGQAVLSSRRSTEFILRPSTQGVVVEALSDVITLKQIPTGFTLAGASSGLALSPATVATPVLLEAAHLTRSLNLSTMPTDALLRLAIKQIGDAAKAPPLARGPRHRIAAESFLSLGLAAEAESLLQLAAEQDPKEAASADTNELTGVAALLAGRADEARGLTDPRVESTDEAALWRALLQATREEGSASAAAVFAATGPLAFQYPEAIRRRILPLMIETMIQAGELQGAARLLDQRKDDPKLAYARALLAQAQGKTPEALAQLDAIAGGHDQFDRARAAVRAAELRLATGELDPPHATETLDKLLYAWRGDARDLALRERVADLRSQTGAWRTSLSMLRQAELDFPDQANAVHERLKDRFAAMIRDQSADAIPPLDFVATVDENADLVPETGDNERLEQSLADRLVALDLPVRAKPVLEKLMRQAKSDVAKARFGNSLAALEAREGDDAGALAVLDASKTADLPADLAEQRLIVRAGAVARRGDPTGAAAMLAPVRTSRAMEARAQILEAASDWPGAEQVWTEYAATTLPQQGMLDEAQMQLLLRLVTATTRAHDDAGIVMLRGRFGDRVGNGPLADMFRLLTAEPVKSTADIKRSNQETGLAASLPTDLKALQAKMVAR